MTRTAWRDDATGTSRLWGLSTGTLQKNNITKLGNRRPDSIALRRRWLTLRSKKYEKNDSSEICVLSAPSARLSTVLDRHFPGAAGHQRFVRHEVSGPGS